jgi:hypothetical protein
MPSTPLPPVTPPKQERRRLARRRTDLPPTAHQNWLIALIVRNPVLTGMTLALVVSAVALALVVSALVSVRNQQHHLASFQRRSPVSREETLREVCKEINVNAVVGNRQTDYLKAIILTSVQQSRPFEKVYRQFGLPDYADRLKEAQKTAAGLEQRKVPVLDCGALIRRVEAEDRQP